MKKLLVILFVLVSLRAEAAIAVGANVSFKTGTGAGTSGAVTEMTGATTGDIFVAVTIIDGAGTSLARPSGWTPIDSGTLGATEFDYDISCVVRGGSAPSLTWSWTGSEYYEVHILRFTGADTTNCFDLKGTAFTSASGNKGATRAASDIDPPSTTPSTPTSMAVAIGVHWAGSLASWTGPTGYTYKSTNTAGIDVMMAVKLLSSGAAEDPDEFFENVTTNDSIYANVVMLKEPAAGGATSKPCGTRLMGIPCH